MSSHRDARRRLLAGMVAVTVTPWWRVALATDGLLPVTPSDAEGPFYPVDIPADSDNDLLRVTNMDEVAPGQVAYVHGTVRNRAGQAIKGARVEIWQCDNGGVYHHPGDPGKPDKRFQGFGAMVTDKNGNYHFRTLRPVPYAGRTPHIHYRVSAPGFKRLTTQLYVNEEQDRNTKDFLYNRHSKTERALVTTSFHPNPDDVGVAAQFDIVLA